MANIFIDDQPFEVDGDKNLLEVILQLGLDLSYFCWHPAMGSVGSCRQCAVQVFANDEDTRGRIMMACMTPVTDGMRLSLNQESARQFRETGIEVLMANHPHDCPVCEEGGECHLQDVTMMSGHNMRRFRGQKKTYENQNLGPCIGHEMNRCISCYRCVRFYQDYAGGADLQAMASRENVYFGRFEPGTLESPFSGNLAEVCPTGVFTDKTFSESYNRKWDLQAAPSVCSHCSLGCNISPNERYNKIKRVVNRYHPDINGYFICDRGRFGYQHLNLNSRLYAPMLRNDLSGQLDAVGWEEIWHSIESMLVNKPKDSLLGIGSGRASVEENLALRELVGEDNFFCGINRTEQQLLIQVQGIYQMAASEVASIKRIEQSDLVLVIGEDLVNTAPRLALGVRQATRNHSLAEAEKLKIPLWQDAAIRTLAQDDKSPVLSLNVVPYTDPNVITDERVATPAKLVASLETLIAAVNSGVSQQDEQIDHWTQLLLAAKRPAIVSGTSLGSTAVLAKVEELIEALQQKSQQPLATQLVLNECNSLGQHWLQQQDNLNDLMSLLLESDGKTLVVLLNDLYQHIDSQVLDEILARHQLIVLDYLPNRTQQKAQVVIPAAPITETEGTLVNNEGRAQRFFAVFASQHGITDNWRHLVHMAKLQNRHPAMTHCGNFDDLVALCEQSYRPLELLKELAPDAKFTKAGLKVPRQSHRYSGRTSMNADVSVHEPKATQDPDSPLGFTMEGVPVPQQESIAPITWAPGWNSNEAVNKFQAEINGELAAGNPGMSILSFISSVQTAPLMSQQEPEADALIGVIAWQIFGSEDSSALAPALKSRTSHPFARMHSQTIQNYKLHEQAMFSVGDQQWILSVQADDRLPENLVAIGKLPGVNIPRYQLPAELKVEAL